MTSITTPKALNKRTSLSLPMMLTPIAAGFPSPAEGEEDAQLDLNELMVRNPHATFFARVKGDSMTGIGIMPGSIVVIDKAKSACDGDVVAAWVDGAWTIKRYRLRDGAAWLDSENDQFQPIRVTDRDSKIWGIVTWTCHKVG